MRRLTPTEFVLAHTHPRRAPFVPELRLHLAPDGGRDAEAAWEETRWEAPPFWAFVWAGGQAVARYLLDDPSRVAGRDVVDVATGSGLVAIAAAVAGARTVTAYDVDELAVAAARSNARLNGVKVTAQRRDVREVEAAPGALVTVGDVFYDEKLAAVMLPALTRLVGSGAEVLVGDPHRAYLPLDALEELASYEVEVESDLEDAPVKPAVVARLRPDRAADRAR